MVLQKESCVSCPADKTEEVRQVKVANAVVSPGACFTCLIDGSSLQSEFWKIPTVMVHPQHTSPTFSTVMTSWWFPPFAPPTPPSYTFTPEFSQPLFATNTLPHRLLTHSIRQPTFREPPWIGVHTPIIRHPDAPHTEIEPGCMR